MAAGGPGACCLLALLLEIAGGSMARAAEPPAPARVELRSKDFLVVGVLHGETLDVHVSRALDNAAVRDAAVSLVLRGSTYPATAAVDGGYAITAKDLAIPGSAAVVLRVVAAGREESLHGTLDIGPGGPKDADQNNLRQMGWWVLNFGVCIGFLMLIARRRKATPD
jgi:hypothetical protein